MFETDKKVRLENEDLVVVKETTILPPITSSKEDNHFDEKDQKQSKQENRLLS